MNDKKMVRKNHGYKYLLTAIDVLSKKAYVKILKKKNSPTVDAAFRELLDAVKPNTPKNLRTDKGTGRGR